MHIGFLTTEYPSIDKPEGGLATYIHKTSHELAKRGFRVTVFILAERNDAQTDENVKLRFVVKAKVHWRLKQNPRLAPWLNLYEQWLNAQRIRLAVMREHRQFPLNIVQTPNFNFPGIALIHNKQFPLVCRCSSCQPLWRSANGIYQGLPEAIGDWLEGKLVVESNMSYAPSQFVSTAYERFYAVKPRVICTPLELPNQLGDPSVYQEMVPGKKYLLFFGTMNGVKGADVLINAAPEILSNNQDLYLFFIGRKSQFPGKIKSLELLQNVLGNYLQESRVIYSPTIPKAQLNPVIQNALGVVLPSRVDNYPNACLEALSLGIPVIGTYESSLDEMVEDGRTGFLAKNGDPASLQEAIYRLISQTTQQRAKMIRNIQAKIAQISNEDRIGQLVTLYEEAIARFSQ